MGGHHDQAGAGGIGEVTLSLPHQPSATPGRGLHQNTLFTCHNISFLYLLLPAITKHLLIPPPALLPSIPEFSWHLCDFHASVSLFHSDAAASDLAHEHFKAGLTVGSFSCRHQVSGLCHWVLGWLLGIDFCADSPISSQPVQLVIIWGDEASTSPLSLQETIHPSRKGSFCLP